MDKLFFGYSGKPESLREAISQTVGRLASHPLVSSAVSWEDLRVDGRFIIHEIENAIQASTFCIFDVTTLNHNVLFELGFAIGQGKRVAILLDSQDRDAAKRWATFGLLTTTGYTPYRNSGDLEASLSALITSQTDKPLLDHLLQGVELPIDESRLTYVPSLKQDEPSRALSRILELHDKFDLVQLELDDYGTSPLAWWVEQLYQSRYAIFHFTPERTHLAEAMNPRAAFLAGLSRGLGRGILVLTEAEQYNALDYRDLSIRYGSSRDITAGVERWLTGLGSPPPSSGPRIRRHLSAELAALRFGNHVAESDKEGLDSYFVETRDYHDVLESVATVFTGRKGTGKTANMLQAATALQADARNLVCVIKPASYELEALVEVLREVDSRHLNDYLIEALWKYLLYTEIGSRAVIDAERRPAGIAADHPLAALKVALEHEHMGLNASFSVRLEKLVNSLTGLVSNGLDEQQIDKSRRDINAALYGGTLKDLRSILGKSLAGRDRVAVLVDNLDKAWERGADLELLARLLLGLLAVIGKIVDELRRETPARDDVRVSLTVFLRSDIYAYIRDRAREPDKISVAEIEWRDPAMLARVLEDRFLAGTDKRTASDLWNNYFDATVKGLSSREYILSRVQPRPRDLVFFANAAVARATNAKHAFIAEADILEAEKTYSQFAFEALMVEGVASGMGLESALIELAGETSILEKEDLLQLLQAGSPEDDVEQLIVTLRRLGFLGIETTEDNFDYGGTDGEMLRSNVLAKKLGKSVGRPARFEIHPAYRAYLDIRDS